jgi:hypothetical protein
MGELHYASTVSKANFSDVPIDVLAAAGATPRESIQIDDAGEPDDVVNAAVGLSGQWGSWNLLNGVVVPLQQAPDRAFDFQYNVQIQRLF